MTHVIKGARAMDVNFMGVVTNLFGETAWVRAERRIAELRAKKE